MNLVDYIIVKSLVENSNKHKEPEPHEPKHKPIGMFGLIIFLIFMMYVSIGSMEYVEPAKKDDYVAGHVTAWILILGYLFVYPFFKKTKS